MSEARDKAAGLSCWTGSVDPRPLGGGITNTNFTVEHAGDKFVVRIGDDIPVHGVMRFNELAAGRAAHAAGISPEIVHAEPGAMVMRFIEGKTFAAEDVRIDANLERIVPLIRAVHHDIPDHLRGPALVFWVFQVCRDYAATIKDANPRVAGEVTRLMAANAALEEAVGPIRVIFGHNDLLPANFIDDGDRLWLVDWDYAGFNSPLFDLGGLASNNELSPEQEEWLLEAYFGAPADDGLRRRYGAMKCASLLRETMWSMVSEVHSELDFDYVAYTGDNLSRFERTYSDFQTM